MPLTPEELEQLADELLKKYLKDKRKNKSKLDEYPILSPSQLKRRQAMEIPYSSLSEKQRLECKMKRMDYYPREVDW